MQVESTWSLVAPESRIFPAALAAAKRCRSTTVQRLFEVCNQTRAMCHSFQMPGVYPSLAKGRSRSHLTFFLPFQHSSTAMHEHTIRMRWCFEVFSLAGPRSFWVARPRNQATGFIFFYRHNKPYGNRSSHNKLLTNLRLDSLQLASSQEAALHILSFCRSIEARREFSTKQLSLDSCKFIRLLSVWCTVCISSVSHRSTARRLGQVGQSPRAQTP